MPVPVPVPNKIPSQQSLTTATVQPEPEIATNNNENIPHDTVPIGNGTIVEEWENNAVICVPLTEFRTLVRTVDDIQKNVLDMKKELKGLRQQRAVAAANPGEVVVTLEYRKKFPLATVADLLAFDEQLDIDEERLIFVSIILFLQNRQKNRYNSVTSGTNWYGPLSFFTKFFLILQGNLLGSFVTFPKAANKISQLFIDHVYKLDLQEKVNYKGAQKNNN